MMLRRQLTESYLHQSWLKMAYWTLDRNVSNDPKTTLTLSSSLHNAKQWETLIAGG